MYGWAVTGSSDSPERLDFWSEPELALNEVRRQLQKETRTTKEPVLTHVIYTENDDQEGRVDGTTPLPFLSVLPYSSASAEGRECR